MRILFDTIEEKEEYIEDSALYDVCPSCGEKYNDFESCMNCCACAREEIYNDEFSDEDDDF